MVPEGVKTEEGDKLVTKDFLETHLRIGINSPKDDFGIIWDATTSSGYFNSNRG